MQLNRKFLILSLTIGSIVIGVTTVLAVSKNNKFPRSKKATKMSTIAPTKIDEPATTNLPEDYGVYKFAVINQIDSEYHKSIKPLLQKACFDCHSIYTEYPWYHDISFIRGYMDRDIRKGRQKIDMSLDFPFQGDFDMRGVLLNIKSSLVTSSMPPLRYKVMHWNQILSESEVKTITSWVDSSVEKMDQTLEQKADQKTGIPQSARTASKKSRIIR